MDGQNSSIIIPSIVDKNLVMKIRILLVDNDTLCLGYISTLLNMLNYEVVTASTPLEAISALRVNHASFDMVLSDLQFTSMHGFFFQKLIEQEFRIPIVFMTSNPIDNYLLANMKNGGVYFVCKPPTTIDIKNMWEFVTLRRKSFDIIFKNSSFINNNTTTNNNTSYISVNNNNNTNNNIISVNNNNNNFISVNNNNNNYNYNSSNNYSLISSVDVCSQSSNLQQTAHIGSSSSTISAQQCHAVEDPNATNSAANQIQTSTNDVENKAIAVADEGKKKAKNKRRKMHWTAQLHDKFVEAIFVIGEDRAVPKKIMEYMNEPSLSRENIASHLQKYRIYSRRVVQEAKEDMQPNQIVVQNWGGRSRSNFSQLQDNNNYPFLNPNNNINALSISQLQGAITPTYYNNNYNNNAPINNNNNQFQGNMLLGQNNFNNSIPNNNNNNLVHNSPNLNNGVQLMPFNPNTTTFVEFGGNMNMNNNGYNTNNINNTNNTNNNNNVPCNNNAQLMSQNGAYFENGLNNNGVDQNDVVNHQQLGFMANNDNTHHVIMSKDNHFNATSGGDDFHDGLYNNNTNVVTATTDKVPITSPQVNGSDITQVTIDGSEQDDIASNMMNNNDTLGDVVSPFMVFPNMENNNMMMMSTNNDQPRVMMSYPNMNTSNEEVALGNRANSTLALGNCASSTLTDLGNHANSTLADLGNRANPTFQLEDVVNRDMSTINFASGSQTPQGWLSGNLDDFSVDYSHAAEDLSSIFSNVDAYQKGNNNY